MQKIVSTLVLILFVQLFSLSIFAQSPPEAINYQAVARNLAGVPMVNQSISVQYAILQGSSSGTVVYSETHAETTNQFGLFTSEIGLGSVNSGNFSTINWGSSIFYLQVTVDGDVMPATQLLSVPYALHAKTATSGVPGADGHNSLISSVAEPAGLNCANGGYLIESGLDADDNNVLDAGEVQLSYYICNGADGANGLNGNDGVGIDSTIHNADGTLTIYYSNSTTYTTNDLTGPAGSGGTTYFAGNGISLSGDTITNLGDADADPTNEIQLLSLNATSDTIFLTNGGFVALPSASGDTDWIQGAGVIYNTTDMVGIGTPTPLFPLDVVSSDTVVAAFRGNNPDFTAVSLSNTNPTSDVGIILLTGPDTALFGLNPTDKMLILDNSTSGGHIALNADSTIISYAEVVGNIANTRIYNKTNSIYNESDSIFNYSTSGKIVNVNQGMFLTDSLYVLGNNSANPNWVLANDGVGQAVWKDPSTLGLGGSLWQSNSPDIYFNTGNVGIGTTTPSAPLTIENANPTDLEFVGGGNSDIVAPNQLNIEAGTVTFINSGFDTHFWNNGADRMTILSSGDVGVGTTTPTTNLDVVGRTKTDSITISDGAVAGAVLTATDAFGNAEWQLPGATGDNWGTDTVNVAGGNIIGSGTVSNPLQVIDNDTSATNEFQSLSLSNDTLFLSNGNSVQLPSSSDGNGIYSGSDTLSGTTTVYQNGNTITFNGGAAASTTIATFERAGFLGASVDINSTGSIASMINLKNGGTTTGSISSTPTVMNLSAGTGNDITIDNTTGRVGIATSSPASRLHIFGNSSTEPQLQITEGTSGFSQLRFTNLTPSKYWAITASPNASDASSGMNFYYNDGTVGSNVLAVYGDGRVAVNNPAAASTTNFDVWGTSMFRDTIIMSKSGYSSYKLPIADGTNPGDVLTTDASGNTYWGSAAAASPWTQIGDSLFPSTSASKVGIGTTAPKSDLQIGNYMHMFPLNISTDEYSVSAYNAYWDGTTIRNTNGGTSGITILGHEAGNPMFGVQLFPAQAVNSDVMSVNPILRMNLKDKGLGINKDNPEAGLHITAIDSASIIMDIPEDGSSATMIYRANDGNYLGLKVPNTLPSGSYDLTYPTDLPASSGSPLVSDLNGNLSWGTPSVGSLWTDASPNIYYNTGNVGIGTTNPLFILDVDPGASYAGNMARIRNTNASSSNDALQVVTNGIGIGATIVQTGTGHGQAISVSNTSNTNYALQITTNAANDGIHLTHSGASAGATRNGIKSIVSGVGGSQNIGGSFSASGATISNNGLTAIATPSGSANGTGIYSTVGGSGSGVTYGVYGQNTSSSTGVSYGGYFQNMNTTGALIYGVRSEVNGISTIDQYGFRADVNGASSGTKYGLYSVVLNGTGTQYGVYSNVSGGASNWAGFFAAGDVFVNENVGIGTTTPHAPLQFGTALTNRKIVLFEAANNDHEFFGFGINGGLLRYQANGHHAFYTATSSTTSSELMRITSIGNVGIGITNPTQKLHVLNGTIRIDDGVKPYNLPSSDGSNSGDVLTTDAAGNTSWQTLPSAIWSQSGSEIHYNSGHVGIGNSNPNYLFHIQDSTASAGTVLMQVETMLGLPILRIDNDQKLDINGSLKLNDGSQGVGHVLTSIDAAGNATWKGPVNFGVNSCVMGIPAGTTTGLIFDNVEYDNGGNFNVGTGQFKAPEDGIYHVDAVVSFDVSSNFEIQLQILRNGGTYKRVTVYTDPSNSTITAQISADVYLLANNTVSVGIYQNSGGTITPVSSGAISAVYFNGHLVR